MRKLLLLPLLLTTLSLSAQKGTRFFTPDDPLVGNWQVVADSLKGKQAPPIIKGESIIQFAPGIEVGMFARSQDSLTGPQFATYFTAKKDAMKIYCSISESHYSTMNGRDISFRYEYQKDTDTLIVILGEKKYFYSRMK